MNPALNTPSVTLAANASVAISVTGSFLLFTSNTGPFKFQVDNGPMTTGLSILGIDLTKFAGQGGQPAGFTTIILQDTSGAQNTINFITANAAITYINPNATYFQKDAPTFPKGSGVLATDAVVFSGVGPQGQQRKHFTISNLDAGTTIHVTDGTNAGLAVPPGQSRILATSGSLKISNPTLVNWEVLEVFYV